MAAERILVDSEGRLKTPAEPLLVQVTGDASGRALLSRTRAALDEAVTRAYRGRRRLHWMETEAGPATLRTLRTSVPEATVQAVRTHRVALVAPWPAVPAESRTLAEELRELLDLHLGLSPLEGGLLRWENRESSAAGLALEEGGSDAARISAALEAATGRRVSAGFSVSMHSRVGVERFVRGAMAPPGSTLLQADASEKAFVEWALSVDPTLQPMPLSEALGRVLGQAALPSSLLASANSAAHFLRLAAAAGRGALGAARLNPQTGHGVFGALLDELPEAKAEAAMLESAGLLLRHLGWVEAAERLLPETKARAS